MEFVNYDFTVTDIKTVVHRPYTASWNIKNLVSAKNYVIVICLDGESFYEINGEQFTLVKNDVRIFPPGVVRNAWSNPEKPWCFISINFELEFPDNSETPAAPFPCFMYNTIHLVSEQIRKKFLEIDFTWSRRNTAFYIKCKTLLQYILVDLLTMNRHNNFKNIHYQEIEQAKLYIQEHFTAPISTKQLADIAKMSESYFRKLFREINGMSATQYMIYLRINKAKDLLASGTTNVTETALICGFSDVFYFSNLFKKNVGITPSEFLKNI